MDVLIGKWSHQTLEAVALQFNTKSDFRRSNYPAYKAAHKLGIIDDICSHMDELRTTWTDEMLANEAKKYSTKMEFYSESRAYQIAAKRGILDSICGHMDTRINRWTDDSIYDIAAKYETRTDFKSGSPLAYVAAQRRDLLDSVCAHMEYKFQTWTDDAIKVEASRYSTRDEFRRASSAYQVAVRRGILNDVCTHMSYTERVNWTPELLQKEAKKYSTRADFYRKSNNAYSYARRLGILDEITNHLGYMDTYNTRDVVYLWYAEGDIFKVGITSENLSDKRIYDVAKEAGYEPEILLLENVGTVAAKRIEKEVLSLGHPVSFRGSFSGSSEFRHFSPNELNQAIDLILA
jgi:hypothetical protein